MSAWQVEVLSVGTWNGDRFVRADLQELAGNFARLKGHLKVPLKFGHADGQTLLGQADGDPALGWVSGLSVQGERLVATFSHVPAVVRQAVEANLYRRVSCEVAYGVRYQGARIGKVLVGVALLGADLPAVTNLADLGAYLSARGLTQRRVYAFNPLASNPSAASSGPDHERSAMTEPIVTEVSPQQAQPPAEGAGPPAAEPGAEAGRTERLAADLQFARDELERYRQREARLHEQSRLTRFSQARAEFMDALDGLVREGRLQPHARDAAQAAVAAQAREFQTGLSFSAELVRRLLQGTRPLPQGETAAGVSTHDLAAAGGPLQMHELQREVARLTATGKYTVAEAQAHLLAADPVLAARWMQAVNQTLPPEVQS